MYLRCVLYFLSCVTPRPGLRRGAGAATECWVSFISCWQLVTFCEIEGHRLCRSESFVFRINHVCRRLMMLVLRFWGLDTFSSDLSLFIFHPIESIELYNSFKVDLHCDRLEGITGDTIFPRRKGLKNRWFRVSGNTKMENKGTRLAVDRDS